MNIVIIGRSELMFDTLLLAVKANFNVVGIVTAREASEYKYTVEDFVQFAKNRNIPWLVTSKLESQENLDFFSKLGKLDLALSVNFSGIIPQHVIDLFSIGILNAHGGDLPRYRGNACQAWALINGEDRIGLCIHKMIGGELDSGDIIKREFYPANINTKIGEVWDWMNERIPKMFLSAAQKLCAEPYYILEIQSKDPKDALRCYPRRPEDGRIDWSKPAEDILRLINASGPPYAGAFTFLGSEKVFVHDADLSDDVEVYCAVPGQVVEVNREIGNVTIATGKGKLDVLLVIIEGKVCRAESIFNSIRQRFI